MSRIRKIVVSATAAVGLLGGSLMDPTPAEAIFGKIYVVAPRWWGWCPGSGNYALRIVADNLMTGDRAVASGDVAYLRIDFERQNPVAVTVQCRWSNPQGNTYYIRPTRNNQTFYFGATGGYYAS